MQHPVVRGILGAVGVLLALAAWQLGIAWGILPAEDIPTPAEVISSLVSQVQTGEFWAAVRETMQSVVLGLAGGAAIALPLAIAMGQSESVDHALRPTVEFLRPVPSLALIPFTMLKWGPTQTSVIFLVAFTSIWPLLIQTLDGIKGLDETAMLTARSLRIGRLARLRWVVIPGTLPYVATGLRIAASVALIVAVSVELITGAPGLGSAISDAQNALALEKMYALIMASGLLGIVLYLALTRVERHLLHWHPGYRP